MLHENDEKLNLNNTNTFEFNNGENDKDVQYTDVQYTDTRDEYIEESMVETGAYSGEMKTLNKNEVEQPDIEDIYSVITNPNYGLEEIKREVRAIERNVKETIVRLEARNKEIQCKLDCIIACMNCKRRFTLTTGRVRRECRVANLFINICNNSRRTVELEIRRKNLSNNRNRVCTICIKVGPDSCKEVIFRNIPDTYEIEIRGVTEDIEVTVTEVCCGDNGSTRPIRLCRIPDTR